MRTRSPTTILLFALPLLLLLTAAGLGVLSRIGTDSGPADSGPAGADRRQLALPPVEAPDAAGPACTRLVAALPAELPADTGPLTRRVLAQPAPVGALAWSGIPGPDAAPGSGAPAISVVLRCGLPRPAELVPGAALIQVNSVVWLTLSQPDRDTFISVDRPVYVALTVPRGAGSGPVQAVSDVLRDTVPTG